MDESLITSGRVLSALQAFVAVTAIGGGVGLAAAPDGHYLGVSPAILTGTPFSDFLVPGLLLAVFVGGGGVVAAVASWRLTPHWQPLALAYALGLVAFEAVEYSMISFNVQQAIVAGLGLVMLGVIAESPRRAPRPA